MTNDTPARRVKKVEVEQLGFLNVGPVWKDHWWGMPSFEMGDARPMQRIMVNFHAWDDVVEFGNRLGLTVTRNTDSLWFPPEHVEKPSDWRYDDAP